MSVKSFAGNFYQTVITVGNASAFSGISDISIQATKPITLYKPLDAGAPIKVKGKLTGKITIDGMVIDSDSFDRLQAAATLTSTAPALTTIVLTNGTASASYSGYPTGTGFSFRNMAPRTWVLDKKLIYTLID